MDSLEVEVDVNEAYINRVHGDQPVQVTLNAYPDDHYRREVIAIIPTADRSKATVRVRVGFSTGTSGCCRTWGSGWLSWKPESEPKPATAPRVLFPAGPSRR